MADSVLTSGCSFISQRIWIKICIMLASLSICIKRKKVRRGKESMWIHRSGLQSVNLGTLSSGIVTGWGDWHSRQRWCRLWRLLSASVRWTCTCLFATPAWLRILCGAILVMKTSCRVVFTKHSRVSFLLRLHPFMPRKLTPRFFSARTLVCGIFIRYSISSVTERENSCLAILAIFKARRMLDNSSSTRPPCLAIVADILKTFKKLVAASNNEIRLLPQPYIHPSPPLRWLEPVLSTHGYAHHGICPWQSHRWQHHEVQLCRLWGQMPCSTMEVSHYGQRSIGHVTLYVHRLWVIQFISGCLPHYGYTHIQLHAASFSRCFGSYGRFFHVHPGSYFGSRISSIVVDWLVSAFLLCANEWCIGSGARQSAWVGSAPTRRSWLRIHDMLVWNWRGRW